LKKEGANLRLELIWKKRNHSFSKFSTTENGTIKPRKGREVLQICGKECRLVPTNLELKIKVTSHQSLIKILEQIGAENKEKLIQKDVYYSIPNGLLKLRIENGNESLIYCNRNENDKNRWSVFEVLKFANGKGEKFFNNLFDVEVIVKKKRELFYYDDTRIHLDTVKFLGKFLELETLVINSKVDAKKRFEKIISLLKLDESKQIRKSYRDLIMGGTK